MTHAPQGARMHRATRMALWPGLTRARYCSHMPDYHDDLRLAHVLADAADAATMERFKALDLKVETKPDMTPVSEADKAAEELIRTSLQRTRPRDAVLGEEFGIGRARPPPLGHRPHRRDQELRARRARLGDADRPDGAGRGRRPPGGRPRLGARAQPPLVGRAGRRRLHRAQPDRRRPASGSPRCEPVRDASFAYSSLSGWEERGMLRRLPGSDAQLLAHARRTATSGRT